jgi:hypothetical protein
MQTKPLYHFCTMKDLLIPNFLPTPSVGNTAHRFRNIGLGALASLLSAPALLSATSAASEIKLSPMIARSTVLSPTDPRKEISVVLSLPLSDSTGAAAFVQRVSNPKDPL